MLIKLCFFCALISLAMKADAAFYVDNSAGNDTNNGVSAAAAWKTLAKAGNRIYGPGDSLLLKCGEEWNEQLTIRNSAGTADSPVVISSYGTGVRPRILRNNGAEDQCLRLESPSGFHISNLDAGNAGQGIFLWFGHDSGKQDIRIEDCYFHDIGGVDYWTWFSEPRDSEKFRTTYSNAIAVSGFWDSATAVVLSNLSIRNCNALNAKCLFMVGCTRSEGNKGGLERSRVINNFTAENCTTQGGTFGWWVERVDSGSVTNVIVRNAGIMPFGSGTTGGGMQSVSNFEIRGCEFGGTLRSGGPDGCGFDFEGDCWNIRCVKTLFHDNAGVGLFFYGGEGGNSDITIDSCTFSMDNVDPGNISGYEIYISNNTGGAITNNRYMLRPGIQFVNAYSPGTVFAGNTGVFGSAIPATVTLIPASAAMLIHESARFQAVVRDAYNGTIDTAVAWSVTGGGGIDSTGLFSSNGDTGTFTVRAAVRDTPQVFAEVAVRVATEPYISNMAWESFTIGDGSTVYRDRNHGNQPININGRVFDKGVGTAAFPAAGTPADIVLNIAGKEYRTFTAMVGQDNGCPSGSVNFEILVDDILKTSSPVLRSTDSAYAMAADVSGGSTLTLRVWNGGDNNACDWADWGDAKLSTDPWTPLERSIPTPASSDMLTVYPNPFNPQVTLRMGNSTALRILNINGKCVADFSKSIHGGIVCWKPQNLASGIYIIQAKTNNWIVNKVILLQK